MTPPALSRAAIVEIRAALEAGASPAAALGTLGTGPLAPAAAAARVGRPLTEVAAEFRTGEAHADLLVRALAVVERTGAGGAAAVDQVLDAIAAEQHLQRVLQARTAQARMSARVLTMLPGVLWFLLVGLDPAALRFYGSELGAASAGLALALGVAGWWWSRGIVARCARAAAAADPLARRPGSPDVGRALAVGVPVLLAGTWTAGPLGGFLLAGAAAALAARPAAWRSRTDAAPAGAPSSRAASAGAASAGVASAGAASSGAASARAASRRAASAGPASAGAASVKDGGGAAETVELLAAAMAAGLDSAGALVAIEPLAPPAARPLLRQGAARLRAGWDPAEAFAGTGLADLGAVLAATGRWGAPAHAALRRLAEDLRGGRRTAAEVAAERAQVALIFPTTLLTLPAFVVALVPPLVWTAFAP